jgi:outer membrane protein insertion porin family
LSRFGIGGILKHIVAFLLTLAILLIGAIPAFSLGEKLADVTVAGNHRIDSAVVLGAIKTKPGDVLTAEAVDADIRSIYKLGHFQDVTASSETTDKGTVLTYTVIEKPVVRDIKLDGNKELSSDKIKEAVELKQNAIFSAAALQKSIRKVKKLYADEGYYLAEVTADTEPANQTDVKVTFRIKEGDKVLIREIAFEGNKAFPPRKLKGVMETKEKWFLSWLTGAGTYKEEVLKNDVALIADHYFNNGYINVRVGEPRVKLLDDKSGFIVAIPITEGEQYRNGALDFKGDLLAAKEELLKKLTMLPGEIFSRAKLRSDIGTLTDFYADQGYAFANITPQTKLNPENRTVDLTFEIEKGEKVYIENINIGGNTKTRDKVVRREVRLGEGELYGATKLKKSKQNLMNLGFFEEANIATAAGSAPNKLNINVDVKEKPTGTFSIGGGYSSLDGFIAQGSVQQSNFLGLGLKATLAASIGGRSQTYNLGLTDPHFLDTDWTLGADIYRTDRQYINFTRRATGGDIKAGYSLSDDVSTFWVYKLEKVENYDITTNDPTNPIVPFSTTSSIYGSITRNSTDYRLDPTKGMMNTASIEFAGLGGTSRFLRYQGETAVFHPVIWSIVGSLKGTLGYIQTLGKPIPRDERYLLGGINTIRGYSSRTVSPVVKVAVPQSIQVGPNPRFVNDYIGGDKEAILNAELTFPLIKEAGLKGVVFFDAGNSYGDAQSIFSSFLTSYGAGVRWVSPIGPLRLEYGIPINPRTGIDNTNGRFEFSIGGFF